ncbi:MAG: flagellar hook-associated protein FlgK [Sulfurimonas sp.]|nr:flagellar hook-associated protein FlgK [Sulfurimonas sp.]MBU3938554.1 flagellar hook-associated protein FlgK [bacterium]MBU4024621.1 flagellar hook-associated protein FlgK [bacterium]MBU4059610.1 flagellar hook-associated protein FlgK [bacterium]MBU4110065.1 flagellar hook-associated protein FlgK [bacterium]
MASMFNTLGIGYSALNAAQVGISTTGHNIANAENEGYTRQRVITAAATPITARPGQVGNGTEVTDIKRVFDNFVFDRYTAISSSKEYSDYEQKTLDQLSSYFPEIDGVGVKADLQEFYNMWQNFADNPDNDAIKVALSKQTQTLSEHIRQSQSQISSLQMQVNEEMIVNVNEVNALAKELAGINIAIDTAESGGAYSANDLRDKRNVIERSLARLIGAEVNSGQLQSNIQIDSSSNTKTGSYTLSVNGFNIVDGNTYHPIHATKTNNPNGFYELSYERQDGTLIPLEEIITSGKIGAILDLRGGTIDTTSGVPTDGIIQNALSGLDAFASTLIESVNNLYASTATTKMQSNYVSLSATNPLSNSPLNIKEGSFNVIVYDIDGNKVATRTINIDIATTMSSGVNSIKAQIEANQDDNANSSGNDDIDDFINFNFASFQDGKSTLELAVNPLSESKGYTFAIEDVLKDAGFSSGSNFAGALGLNRFFDGNSGKNINIKNEYKDNATLIKAGASPVSGDNTIALQIMQHQFEKFDFKIGNKTYETTAYGMFDIVATEVGVVSNSANSRNETISTQFNATQMEYFGVSKVSIDEEMTNLIKYQTSYGAAAKIITTIDQMMQTLLGIKQ